MKGTGSTRLNVLVAVSNSQRSGALADIISKSQRWQVMAKVSNLSQLYHFAENHVPDIVLIDTDLALQREFDVLVALLRGLAIEFMLVTWCHKRPPEVEAVARHHKTPIISAKLSDKRFDELLGDFWTRPTTNSCRLARKDMLAQTVSQRTSFDPARRILIGASTGGIDALMTVLAHFPVNCPPTLVVQHTGEAFSSGLASLLNRNTQASVQLAKGSEKLFEGHVYLAPAGKTHMVFGGMGGSLCRLQEGPPVSGHRPSIDMLFQSAEGISRRVTAALLTGMGSDGAAGMARLRAAGAITVGQDKETSVVYGMPRIAFEMGGVEMQLPLQEIGPKLLSSCHLKHENAHVRK